MAKKQKDSESWIKQYWRPIMAYQYTAVCLFDFLIGPILTMIFFKLTGGQYVQWKPLTLQEGGFYHLSMAAVVGVAAWTRGQEKITRITNSGRYDDEEEEKTVERSTTSQKPVG